MSEEKVKLTDLARKILSKYTDPRTGAQELILLEYCDNETASEHISRYMFASRFAHGLVLDVASGSCYGTSILKRSKHVKKVVAVDINRDALNYGKILYDVECICANATHLPFRNGIFDTVVSLETLEHINDQEAFLKSIRYVLKKGGTLILSTPNKMYSSPLIPYPLNPYHVKEYYLGELLLLLKTQGFIVDHVYGGKRITLKELFRRIIGSVLKYLLLRLSIRPSVLDDLYSTLSLGKNKTKSTTFVDPTQVTYEELKIRSNIQLYQDFLIIAHSSP